MADIDGTEPAAGPGRESPRATDRTAANPPWAVVLGLLAAALLAFYLSPYVVRGYRFAVGADAPVYLWWARLAGHDGLSAVGYRPGVPALVLLVRGTLGLSPVQAVAATGAALAAALGLAGAAVGALGLRREPAAGRRRRTSRMTWALAGLFAGLYGASLANGYLSSLATGVVVLGAVAALVARRPGGAVAAVGLLGAAGLSHAAFFLVAVAMLLGVVAWNLATTPRPRLRRLSVRGSDERRVVGAVIGGTGIVAAGLLATIAIGPGPISAADTSKDAFLRRSGLGGELHRLYRQRLGSNWLRSLLPAYVPLAAYGTGPRRTTRDHDDPLLRRVLLAWLALTAAGVAASLATGLLPGERFLSFAFALPILGAAGVSRLWHRGGEGSAATPGRSATEPDRREPARWARPVAGLGIAAVVVGSFLAWWHPAESLRDGDMAAAERAARVVAALSPGTPIVFVVDDAHHAPISVPRFGNELRGAMPPERIRDVHLFVGRPPDYLAGRPTTTGNRLHDEMSARSLRDLREALRAATRPPVALVLEPMNEQGYPEAIASGRVVAPGVAIVGPSPAIPPAGDLPAAPDPVRPSSPWLIVLSATGTLAVLWVAGAGWARAALGDGVATAAAAPAFGIAGLILAGVLADGTGIRLTGAVPIIVSALVAGGGFLFAGWSRRRDRGRIPEER